MKGTGSVITECTEEQVDEAYSSPDETRINAIQGKNQIYVHVDDITRWDGKFVQDSHIRI